jgi:hypothetical protein
MISRPPKLVPSIKSKLHTPDVAVLECERKIWLPLTLGAAGAALLCFAWWRHEFLAGFFGILLILAAAQFTLSKPCIIFSIKTRTLDRFRRSWSNLRWHRDLHIPFSEIREFLIHADMEMEPGKGSVWHLFAVTNTGKQFALTWHLERDPVWEAGEHASRVTGKPLREEDV